MLGRRLGQHTGLLRQKGFGGLLVHRGRYRQSGSGLFQTLRDAGKSLAQTVGRWAPDTAKRMVQSIGKHMISRGKHELLQRFPQAKDLYQAGKSMIEKGFPGKVAVKNTLKHLAKSGKPMLQDAVLQAVQTEIKRASSTRADQSPHTADKRTIGTRQQKRKRQAAQTKLKRASLARAKQTPHTADRRGIGPRQQRKRRKRKQESVGTVSVKKRRPYREDSRFLFDI